jgi:tRNA (guanosine-2'-O-)-methyltransferase
MRRRSQGVTFKDELLAERIAKLERDDPERVIRALSPFVTERRRARLEAMIEQRLGSVAVAFESPHDPHNGAAVIRSCEAFGVQTLHVIEQEEPFLSAATVSRSAEKWIDVVTHATVREGVAALRAGDYELVAAHPEGTLEPGDLASIPRLAVVLGNERSGIGPELMAACARSASRCAASWRAST